MTLIHFPSFRETVSITWPNGMTTKREELECYGIPFSNDLIQMAAMASAINLSEKCIATLTMLCFLAPFRCTFDDKQHDVIRNLKNIVKQFFECKLYHDTWGIVIGNETKVKRGRMTKLEKECLNYAVDFENSIYNNLLDSIRSNAEIVKKYISV